MPVEAKPLFRPDVLRAHLAAFQLPPRIADQRGQLAHWADLLASGRANQFTESAYGGLADFLTDFFVGVLGYTRPADGGDGYTFSREKHVEVDGKFADAVLGRFGGGRDDFVGKVAGTLRCAVARHDDFVVALEGKGPKDPLDRPFAGRRMSAVDQGYRYAINYGVDLNEEAIEICRLSLWIKTAERGKPLTSLDNTIKVGNSVVADPAIHPKAFDWQEKFAGVFEEGGGFDVVVGNPPYVRQELLSAIKPYLEREYRAYHGMADLYVYFYELGLRLLRPGGLLSFVVTNKWMKSGYGEPLRRLFGEAAWIESVVDFGHAKQIFEDADVFPSIIVARKPTKAPKPKTARLCTIPREQLRIEDLSRQIETEGVALPLEQLGADAWQLEPSGVTALLDKIRGNRVPLSEFTGTKPYRGILTGFNEVFLIDTPTRDHLVTNDASCAHLIQPFVRGQDVDRWSSDISGLWMIIMRSSGDHTWPWTGQAEPEESFARTYPSLHAHMKPHEAALRKRQDKGRHWWELRSCAYWDEFARPKLVYQEIQFHPSYAFDSARWYGNNKTFFIPTSDLYLLAVLNSPLLWWHNWRCLPHMKDEALSPVAFLMENLPIATPTDATRANAETTVGRMIEITRANQGTRRVLLDWIHVEHEIEKPSMKLQSPFELDSDGLVAEVKRLRGKKRPLSAAGLRSLRDEHARTIEPAQKLAAEALVLEHELSDLVNAAYGLTPDEVALMWETAPPRMPIGGPV